MQQELELPTYVPVVLEVLRPPQQQPSPDVEIPQQQQPRSRLSLNEPRQQRATSPSTTTAALTLPKPYKLRPAAGTESTSAACAITPSPSPSPANSMDAKNGSASAGSALSGMVGNGVAALRLRDDDELPADARSMIARVHRSSVIVTVLCSIGALFVFALPLSSVSFFVGLAHLRWRRHDTKSHSLHRAAMVFSFLSGILAFGDFVAGVVLAATAAQGNAIRTAVYWWGVVMAPTTYPVFIVAIVLGLVAMFRVVCRIRELAWRAVDRAIAQSHATIVRHYRIVHHKIVASTREEGSIDVIISPDASTREKLVTQCKISEAMLEDALDPAQEARIEFSNGHVGAVFRMVAEHYAVTEDDDDDQSGSLRTTFRVCNCGIFLFANKLCIVLTEARPLFEGRYFDRVDSLPDVVVRMLRSFTRGFETNLKKINIESERLEEGALNAKNSRALLENFALQKSLVFHVAALTSNGSVLTRMAERLQLGQHSATLLGEVIAENSQCQKMANLLLSVTSGLIDERASIISLNLNVTMKNLNSLTIAIALISFFAGVGGMSEFSVMIGGEKNYILGYVLFVCVCFLLAAGIFLVLMAAESLWSQTGGQRRTKKKRD